MEVLKFKVVRVAAVLLVLDIISSISASEVSTQNSSVFTAAERAGIVKLRMLVGRELYRDYMKEDVYLVRWLRDSNLDVEKAKDKLSKSLVWRKENRVDSILSEDFRDILRNCPFDVTGKDREGRPILASVMGQCHLRKLALRNQAKLHRSIIWLLESMLKLGRETEFPGGKPQEGVIIADMSGLSLREHTCLACLPFFTTLFEIYTQYYPEVVGHVYIINMSRLAASFTNLLVPLAPPNRREKVYAFGFDKKEWQAEILKQVDPGQLTPQFGGTKSPKYFSQS